MKEGLHFTCVEDGSSSLKAKSLPINSKIVHSGFPEPLIVDIRDNDVCLGGKLAGIETTIEGVLQENSKW